MLTSASVWPQSGSLWPQLPPIRGIAQICGHRALFCATSPPRCGHSTGPMADQLMRTRCVICDSYKWYGFRCQRALAQMFVETRRTIDPAFGAVVAPPPAHEPKPWQKRAVPLPPEGPVGTPQPAHDRPDQPRPKTRVGIRLDNDLINSLRATGPGWQTRVNKILRAAVFDERPPAASRFCFRPLTTGGR
jgi:uncharacterized protein (DUF4415 family)